MIRFGARMFRGARGQDFGGLEDIGDLSGDLSGGIGGDASFAGYNVTGLPEADALAPAGTDALAQPAAGLGAGMDPGMDPGAYGATGVSTGGSWATWDPGTGGADPSLETDELTPAQGGQDPSQAVPTVATDTTGAAVNPDGTTADTNPPGSQPVTTQQNPQQAQPRAAGGNALSQATGLMNQIAGLARSTGQTLSPLQLQQMLNQMGTPNSGGLTWGQRAQLRLQAQNARAQAMQSLWNAGVRNPRADSRYPQMMQNIRTQIAAQAQSMIQQNFANALAQNQQLLQAAQLQMSQQTQYNNALQGLYQALGRTAGAAS